MEGGDMIEHLNIFKRKLDQLKKVDMKIAEKKKDIIASYIASRLI